MALFYPTLYRRRITDITLDDLQTLGVRGLLLDVDNTLTAHGSQHLSPAVQEWLAAMQQAGIGLTVVSNALPSRVAPFAEKIGLRYTAFSCKPSPIGFWRGVRRLGLPKRQVAAVGDQVFTDIVGANLCGIPWHPARAGRTGKGQAYPGSQTPAGTLAEGTAGPPFTAAEDVRDENGESAVRAGGEQCLLCGRRTYLHPGGAGLARGPGTDGL